MKKVSVLMTIYNAENMLKKSIPSILNQIYTNLEFVIVNDGSTDNSAKIVERFAEQDHRIIFINRTINKGRNYSLNEGLRNCGSDLIAINDADDVSDPDRIKKQVSFLEKNNLIDKFGIIGSASRTIDLTKHYEKDYHIKHGSISKYKVSKNRIFFGMPFIHSSFIYNKKALEEIGGFPTEVTAFIDYFALMKKAGEYPIYGINEILVYRYIEVNNFIFRNEIISQKSSNEKKIFSWAENHYKCFTILWLTRKLIKSIKR